MIRFSQILFAAVTSNAIRFSDPIPFSEALQSREVRSIIATELSSQELSKISADILERALFSARVSNAEYLQTVQDVLNRYLRGDLDFATARLELQQKLDAISYLPAPDEFGAITDFGSDARANLVLKTNLEMAYGYGTWMQGQRSGVLDQWPAQQLYRAFNRKVPRNWIIRWRDAGGQFYGGKMIALKNAPIWSDISRFGTPYPPFDFNSGMWTRDVDRKTAMAFGLIDRDTRIKPETRGFNEDLQFKPDIRDAFLRQALEEQGYHFNGGVLTL